MNKGIKRFFIICAAVTCLGLVAATVGYFTGGASGMEKLSGRYSWIRAGAPEMTGLDLAEAAGSENVSFDSVNIRGDMDICIASGSYADTRLIYDERETAPTFEVKDGTLTVDADNVDSGVLINPGSGDSTPQLTVCIPQGKTLDDINISSDSGDIKISDISAKDISIYNDMGDVEMDNVGFDSAALEIDYGDVTCSSISGKGLKITAGQGDVEVSGRLLGITDVTTDYGDVDILTSLPESSYSVDVKADLGDIDIGSHDYGDMEHISFGSGADMIKVAADMGDISIEFADSL